MYINNSTPNTYFGNFKRIIGNPKEIKQIHTQIPEKYLTILDREKSDKHSLYLFSGKHFNKLIELLEKDFCLIEIFENLSKNIGKKPQKLSYNKALEQLKKGKL